LSIAEASLEAALGALPIPAYANDLRGFVIWQNAAARVVGGDLRGVHYSAAVPPEEIQRSRETFAAVTLSGTTRRRTGHFKTPSGELAQLEVIVAPIRVGGTIIGLFGIAIPSNDEAQSAEAGKLSPRQLDVLRLLVRGKSTSEIADELQLAPETVRNHIRRLLKTLGARSRLEAALIALRHGLVSLDLD
jgi:DNA-binding CsgD family transcriptional regulator